MPAFNYIFSVNPLSGRDFYFPVQNQVFLCKFVKNNNNPEK